MSIHVRWAALCLLAWTAPAARAVDEPAVAKAIARGVAYLKQSQNKEGVWTRQAGGAVGATALAVLTLLECGVSADDPAIQKAAMALRDGAISLTDTYSIALCILFFDRLGEAGDVALIESLTVRLLAGQGADGGWSYECPGIGDFEVHRLQDWVKERKSRVPMEEEGGKKRTVQDLPPQIRQQLILAERIRPGASVVRLSDNSNTQFATLALWVGHRHGLSVEKAVARIEARFRTTQNGDGGWGYNASGPTSGTSRSMTCAGLLGLAVADGVANEILGGSGTPDKRARDEGAKAAGGSSRPRNRPLRDPARDRSVRAGLLKLGTTIGRSNLFQSVPVVDSPDYYFLWSLERVAVVFGLQTIGYKDWYGWGTELVLAQQRGDGSWSGSYPEGGVDTSFALLFLRRSNLVQDLTTSLRGKVHDPGEVALKAGRALGGKSTNQDIPTTPESAGAGSGDRAGSGLYPKLLPPDAAAPQSGASLWRRRSAFPTQKSAGSARSWFRLHRPSGGPSWRNTGTARGSCTPKRWRPQFHA